MRKNGFPNAGIVYLGDGGYGPADLGEEASAYSRDPEKEVLVKIEVGGSFALIQKMTWDDLRAGIVLDDLPSL